MEVNEPQANEPQINKLLKTAMAQNASDVHIKVGSPPIMRVNGELAPMASANKVSQEDALKIAFSVMARGRERFLKRKTILTLHTAYPDSADSGAMRLSSGEPSALSSG